MTSPITAQINLWNILYNNPDKNAPTIASMTAKMVLPFNIILISPIINAHVKPQNGHKKTAAITLVKC